MALSSITGQSPSRLFGRPAGEVQDRGLPENRASLTASEIQGAEDAVGSVGSGRLDRTSIRDAIEKRLVTDVKAGKLTADGADLIRKALDEFDKRIGISARGGVGGPPRGGPPPGPPPAADDDSASGTKTELRRSTITTGSITRTTITYSDGTAETTTSYAKTTKAAKSGTETLLDIIEEISAGDAKGAGSYLTRLHASELIDIRA